MADVVHRDGIDAEPQMATCDVCGHGHACYVGGQVLAADGPTSWETHVCLGCLMRAAPIDGGDACCRGPVAPAGQAEARLTDA